MIRIEDFIKEELNLSSRCKIYQGILESVYGERMKLEIVFNRYSVEINFEEDSVMIFDDIMEEEPSKMTVKSFFDSLKV